MRKLLGLLIALTLFLGASPALAAPVGAESDSIKHLLDYVENSPHTFIRNEESYSGKNFEKHIEEKFNREKAGISTARQFIQRCASKSNTTGKAYLVKLNDGAEQPLGVWLGDELDRFQQKLAPPKVANSAKTVPGDVASGEPRRNTKATRICDQKEIDAARSLLTGVTSKWSPEKWSAAQTFFECADGTFALQREHIDPNTGEKYQEMRYLFNDLGFGVQYANGRTIFLYVDGSSTKNRDGFSASR